MRFHTMLACGGLALALGATAASAAPTGMTRAVAPAQPMAPIPAVATGQDAKLVLVRGGCGWGAHRTWRGRCHFNYSWRGRVRARHWRWRHWR